MNPPDGGTKGSGMQRMASAMQKIAELSKKGAQQGLRLTRTVTKAIPNPLAHIDRLTMRMPKQMSTRSIRKLFRMRHKEELGTAGAAADHEDSSESSSDGEDVTDEQLQERVDKKYFDQSYDAMRAELENLKATYADTASDVEQELEQLKRVVVERDTQLRAVNRTLKKRILVNYGTFIDGVCQIRAVNEDLLDTAEKCTMGRAKLAKAKQTYICNGLRIPFNKRRRDNLRELSSALDHVQEMQARYKQLTNLFDSCQFIDAVRLLRQGIPQEEMAVLEKVRAMDAIVVQWKAYASSSQSVFDHISQCIEDCVQLKYDGSKYLTAMEAAFMLEEGDNAFNKVVVSLWQTAEQLLVKAVGELSVVKEEGADIKTVVRGVASEHLLVCCCQLCGRLIDFMIIFGNLIKCHQDATKEAANAGNNELSAFHASGLKYLKQIGVNIGARIRLNVFELLEAAEFSQLDLDRVLHLHHVLMMFIEATSTLGCDKAKMAEARAKVKQEATVFISNVYQPQRAQHIISFMAMEQWENEPGAVSSFSVVQPLSPDSYKQEVKWVKSYSLRSQCSVADNPFYSDKLLYVQDVANSIALGKFEADPARCVVIPTTSHIANTIFEYVCRVAVRFPPLASEVLDWCEELVSLYVYVAAANFVSVSRATPLEDQTDFSSEARRYLVKMRAMCCAANPAFQNTDFPPPVFESISHLYADQDAFFALGHRITALEAIFPLIKMLRAAYAAVEPVVSLSIRSQKKKSVDMLEAFCTELLHVGVHRLALAAFAYPLQQIEEEVAKSKYEGHNEMRASKYVGRAMERIQHFKYNLPRVVQFPTEFISELFWKRFVFAVQEAFVKGYAKVRKPNDTAASQMLVDSQVFTAQLKEVLPVCFTVRPEHVGNFIKTYFFDWEGKLDWLRHHHHEYSRNELVYWLAAGDRERRQFLVSFLVTDLQHMDTVLTHGF